MTLTAPMSEAESAWIEAHFTDERLEAMWDSASKLAETRHCQIYAAWAEKRAARIAAAKREPKP